MERKESIPIGPGQATFYFTLVFQHLDICVFEKMRNDEDMSTLDTPRSMSQKRTK